VKPSNVSPEGLRPPDRAPPRAPPGPCRRRSCCGACGPDVVVSEVTSPASSPRCARPSETRRGAAGTSGPSPVTATRSAERRRRTVRSTRRRRRHARARLETASRDVLLAPGANLLGRLPEAAVRIESGAVSRRHAVVTGRREVSIETSQQERHLREPRARGAVSAPLRRGRDSPRAGAARLSPLAGAPDHREPGGLIVHFTGVSTKARYSPS